MFTDDRGKKYGKGFGKLLAKLSKQHTEKGRNKTNSRQLARTQKIAKKPETSVSITQGRKSNGDGYIRRKQK
ncbi:hypothetical protein A7K73_08915 [Candidatus Methylacidiphilum fumarolicum]|uniref:Uncharacterized protein n=2 Tax=Candidatus Methylacidiphilum fumarolicum TaxID=591154 RepID=I0JW88_METFB|nr:hypothetical protein A7K73_08915 [Candidatus Methylacidiphilum fumarolicum]TFE77686.1 hypothetical protein A7D33_03425 [Candidatus Methylacidiphilum fumarolicum]CAI9085714.1 conserved protein of unknown function [Candidatus Methylacidiphilum fumarolicum]CCG91507.1 hypothetical protein MFUM_110001 [Methylacidiphilum fumariolicum SolV]